MIFPANLRIVFKTISAIMAGIVLFQQIVWASEILTAQNVTPQPTGVSSSKLQSSQATAESLIGTKNTIEEFSALQYAPTVENTIAFTCTYYKNGRMSSKLLNTPDENGIIYYHYLNEDWNGQGYGRVDKTYRQSALNGEISFKYTYYSGTDRIQTKKAYSDVDWSGLVATYTYYNNSSNRIESKILPIPDEAGNIYYHYIDEDGDARYDKTKRKTSLNGERSYSYTYYTDDPSRIQTKIAYADANWTKPVITYTYYDDATNRLQSKLVISSGLINTYYNDATNLMESKTLSAPDSSGNIYYHYINENWNNQGYGRIDKSKRLDQYDDEFSYAYVYYADSTGRLQTRIAYSDNDWTMLTAAYTYYNDSTNRIEFKTLPTTDSSGMIYYHYINEDWKKQGYGRVDIQKRQTQDADGVIAYGITYYDGSSRVMSREYYSDVAMTSPVFTRTYYNDSLNSVQSLTLTTPDSQGIVYYHYINENWTGQGYGRIDKAKRANALSGELSYVFSYYKDSTGYTATKKSYSDENWSNLFVTYAYYNNANNRVETKTLIAPDALGNIYYHYMDEAGSDPTCGRYDKSRRKTALNGELSYSYSYYADNPFNIQTKIAYLDTNWTKKVATYNYYDDITNRIQSKTITKTGLTITYYNDTTGRMRQQDVYSDATRTKLISSTTYYNDGTNRIQSKYDPVTLILTTYYNDDTGHIESRTLPSPNAQGIIYYHYINEVDNRVDKQVLASADSNGAIAYTYTYFSSSQQAQFKYCYKDQSCTELVITYEYDSSGELINTIYPDASLYTYYPSGRMESKTLVSPDSSGTIYYHYIDENWNGQGYGRVDISKNLVPLNGQLVYSESGGPIIIGAMSLASADDGTVGSLQYIGELSYNYTYYDDTEGRLKTKNAYSDADCTNLIATYNYYNDSTNRLMSKRDVSTGIIYTYYNDSSGCLESETLLSPDSYGNIYYHYLNENWQGRGYGRIDKSLMQNQSSDGAIAYSYSYYNDEIGRLETKNSYSDDNWTILISSYNYSNDPENKITPDIGYTHYSSGRMESATFSMPDSSGNIYYHYIDEDWNGRGYGRIDESIRQSPKDGELSYFYGYNNNDPGKPFLIEAYYDSNWTEPKIAYSTYTSPNITRTYYASGILESMSYLSFEYQVDYTITHYCCDYYIDENWHGLGYGRIDKKTDSSSIPGWQNIQRNEVISYYYTDTANCPATIVDSCIENGIGFWYSSVDTKTITSHGDLNKDPYGDGFYYDFTGYENLLYDWLYYDNGQPRYGHSEYYYEISGQYYDVPSSIFAYPFPPEDINLRRDLRQQVSNLNTSNEIFSSPSDPQQQQVSNLNQYPAWFNGAPIDLTAFRNYNEFIGAVQDKYGANPDQLQILLTGIENSNTFLIGKNSSINGDISGGITLTGTTSDGALVEISSYSGEPFFGDINTPPWLGVFNGSNGYIQGDISVKNGTTVEASLTTTTGPIEFNRQIVSTDPTQSRNDVGSYTNVSTATFESTNYTFTGEGAGGFYFGFSCDSIYSLTQLKTNSESLVYLPMEVMEGQRAPATDTEKHGKLLYDIYYNGKQSLSPIEANLIQTKTQEIVQDALQNVAGMTQNNINVIATAQSTEIINIGQGITAYNPHR